MSEAVDVDAMLEEALDKIDEVIMFFLFHWKIIYNYNYI